MQNKEQHLSQLKAKIELYAPIKPATWESLKAIVQFQNIEKGAFLLRHGQVARKLHFIAKGALRAYFTDLEGNFYNKNIFLENDLAGSTVSLLKSAPSNFTIETLEDSILINIDYVHYRKLIDEYPDFKNYYIAYIEQHWIIKKEQREVSIVMENATERYLKLLETHPYIDQRIEQRHLSSHLGITPTQLSRIRKNLK
jgi:CRP-like cAMP-binding protein